MSNDRKCGSCSPSSNPPNHSSPIIPISIYSTPSKIQEFSIPENIIFYISKNLSNPKVYNKLINLYKYFYLKNPLITMLNVDVGPSDVWKLSQINGFVPKKQIITITKISEKIWLYGILSVGCWPHMPNIYYRNIDSTFASKLFRCDVTTLSLTSQTLKLNDFKQLISAGTIIKLIFACSILENDDENEKIVPIEKIIEILPNLQEFEYSVSNDAKGFCSITYETAENLIEIPHFLNLKKFSIYNIPETFEIERFFEKLKNSTKMDISINYSSNISENYKERLETFVKNLLLTTKKLNKIRPPYINFPGMSVDMYNPLPKHSNRYGGI